MADSGKKRLRAIVVGAGVGGTSTAARLAHAGTDVEVYEKNDFSGGRCSLIHHEGYRFDQGPSLLLLPPLFHKLYHDLGTTLEDHLQLVQCHPNYVIHYQDGEQVVLSSDRAQLGAEVEKWDGPGGARRLEGFLQEAAVHCSLSYDLVLSKTFPSLLSLLRPSFLLNVIALHPFGSLWGRCSRYFRTDRMRRAFSFGSMYLGSSPFDSPGTYSLLQWTETCEGIWYPKGGFHQVVQSLVNIAQSHGATFHFSSPVASVNYDSSGMATGITLADGETREADVVVVNADLVWAHNNLFVKQGEGVREMDKGVGKGEGMGRMEPKELLNPKLARRLLEKPHSCSSISFYWAMDRQIPSLNAHNIFLAEDYKESFDDIFKRKSMPREPSFYVNVPSRIDPSAAPQDKDSIVVLIPVGHLLPDQDKIRTFTNGAATPDVDSQDWDVLVERARHQVIETMETRLGIKGLREMIVWEGVNTPETWKDKFNLTHGSILGITHDFFNVLAFRQQARHPTVRGAYFVGASAHPGTGVPIAIAGSRLCTEAILSDLGVPLPESYVEKPSPPKSALDIQHPRPLLYRAEDLVWKLHRFAIASLLTLLVGLLWAYITGRLAVSRSLPRTWFGNTLAFWPF
ncbi:Phytoene desaturase [Saitozyma sp. JCM 24511]|nr:Phytoene desaturase [Saitozyma sp. JCM 24511]